MMPMRPTKMFSIEWRFAERARIERWTIDEREGSPTSIEVGFDMPGIDDEDLVRFHKDEGAVRIRLAADGGETTFEARSVRIRAQGGRQRLLSFRLTSALDQVRQTRTFAPQTGGTLPICELPGFRRTFPQARGIELLDLEVPMVTQFAEIDADFLRRISGECGAHLIYDANGPRIARDLPAPVALTQAEIVTPTVE